jgi:hypothetical protein
MSFSQQITEPIPTSPTRSTGSVDPSPEPQMRRSAAALDGVGCVEQRRPALDDGDAHVACGGHRATYRRRVACRFGKAACRAPRRRATVSA